MEFKSKTSALIASAMFSAIIAICSWLSIAAAVPFTMQTFGVFMALLCLGGKYGTLSIAAYILLGMIGVPVFAGFKGGFSALFGATGGYIVGFLLIGAVFSATEKLIGKRMWMKGLSLILGLLLCYGFGTLWFTLLYSGGENVTFLSGLGMCVLPFMVPDIVKLVLAMTISGTLVRLLRKH